MRKALILTTFTIFNFLLSCGGSEILVKHLKDYKDHKTTEDSEILKNQFSNEDALINATLNGFTITPQGYVQSTTNASGSADLDALGFTSGRVAYWKLDGSVNSLTGDTSQINDEEGNVHGIARDADNTMRFVTGNLNSAISFDGIDDYIEVASSSEIELNGSSVTLMGWINTSTLLTGGSGDFAILCKGPGENMEQLMLGTNDGSEFNFRVRTSSGLMTRIDEGLFQKGKWYFVVGTYDGSFMRLYVNGRIAGTKANSGTLVSGNDPLFIGKRCVGHNVFTGGMIDEVAIFNRVLSEAEINTIYHAQKLKVTMVSGVVDIGRTVSFDQFSWQVDIPYGKELLNNSQIETGYIGNNVDMSDNILLMHLNSVRIVGGGTYEYVDDSDFGSGPIASTLSPPAVYEQGLFDKASYFDGLNDYIEIPHRSEFMIDEGTINLWFWASEVSITPRGIISKDSSGLDNGGHMTIYLIDRNNISFRLQSATVSTEILTTAGVFNHYQWQMLTVTFGPRGMELFVNGVFVDNNPYTGGIGTSSGGSGNTESIVLGASTANSGDNSVTPMVEFFRGQIDEVAMWKRQLTTTEISSLYKRGTNKVKFQLRSCSNSTCSGGDGFIGPNGMTDTYFSELLNSSTQSNLFDISSLLSSGRYFQYYMEVEPKDTSMPIVIKDVQVNVSDYN